MPLVLAHIGQRLGNSRKQKKQNQWLAIEQRLEEPWFSLPALKSDVMRWVGGSAQQ
jgi:hypothetical protein